MSASDCELCGSPIVTRRIFSVFAVASVHGGRGSVLAFFGVFFFADFDGVNDFLPRLLLISKLSENGKLSGRWVTDDDFRSEDCNGERRTPSNSLLG